MLQLHHHQGVHYFVLTLVCACVSKHKLKQAQNNVLSDDGVTVTPKHVGAVLM